MMFKNINPKIIKPFTLVLLAFVFVYCSKDGCDSSDQNVANKSITVNPSSIDFSDTMVTKNSDAKTVNVNPCLLYTSPSPRDRQKSRMPSSA